jgi:Mn-dependent DtxR family transcriptional regulator
LETSLEKIWQYVQTHQLVQAPTLARAMIISKSRAAALLEDLVKAGLAERVDKKFYRARRVNET